MSPLPLPLLFFAAFCLLAVLRGAARMHHPLRAIAGSALCGVAGIAVLALLAPVTGVTLPANPVTVFTAGVLGLPGVILLVLLGIIL